MTTNNEKLTIGTVIEIVDLRWGESDALLYDKNLIGKKGEVIDHDDDHHTPNNIVCLEGSGDSYYLPNECLRIVGK